MIAKRLQRPEDVQYAQYTGDLGKRPLQYHTVARVGDPRVHMVMRKPLAHPYQLFTTVAPL